MLETELARLRSRVSSTRRAIDEAQEKKDVMPTMDPVAVEIHAEEHQREGKSTRSAMAAIVGVIALLLGGVVGWAIRGNDGGGDPAAAVVGSESLTARQEQMVELHRDYLEAWRAGDVEAIRAMYTPDGTFTFNDVTYEVRSPEFADHVGLGVVGELLPPHLIKGNTMLNFVEVVGYSSENILTFTSAGEPRLIGHVIVSTIS